MTIFPDMFFAKNLNFVKQPCSKIMRTAKLLLILLVFGFTAAAQDVDLQKGLVGYWPFNGNANSIFNNSNYTVAVWVNETTRTKKTEEFQAEAVNEFRNQKGKPHTKSLPLIS